MPVPGPRTQHGPLPGYTNPQNQHPTRINLWGRPAPVAFMGRTPGIQWVNLRGNVLGAGQIRRMWRQAVNYVAAQPAFSWTENQPQPGRAKSNGVQAGPPITRSLRYMTRSISQRSGEDYTHLSGIHTRVRPQVRSKPVTIGAGQVRSRPTVRNRFTSFGSRVPTINKPSPAAQPDQSQ